MTIAKPVTKQEISNTQYGFKKHTIKPIWVLDKHGIYVMIEVNK